VLYITNKRSDGMFGTGMEAAAVSGILCDAAAVACRGADSAVAAVPCCKLLIQELNV
jgi:hypothetical protein